MRCRTAREYAASCRKASGDLVDLTGTEYAVRDLDLLRARVGDQKLSYLGFSYGTYLGTVYADLYPTRVRALTLDGAVDPRQYGDDFLGLLELNARASERSVDAFLAWCSRHARSCGFGGGDAERAVDALIRRLDDHPLVTGKGKRRRSPTATRWRSCSTSRPAPAGPPGRTPRQALSALDSGQQVPATGTSSAPAGRPTSPSSAPTRPAASPRPSSGSTRCAAGASLPGWARP